MKTVKLNELVDIYLGLTHTPEYVLQGVPFLSVKDISNGNIDFSKCSYITEEEYNSLPNGAKPQIGDMLFCRVGTIGKPVIIEPNTPKFGSFVSLGFFRLKNNNLCKLKYLYYWMYSDLFFSQVKQNVKGASQVNLNTGWLSKFDVPLYSIEEQTDIICKLEHLDDLISLRKNQLLKLDEIVKSRFVELFGDPETNPKGLKKVLLSEIAEYYNGLTYTPDNVSEKGTVVLRSSNIQNSQLDFADTVRVDCSIKEKLLVNENDILMCSRNGSARLVGKVALIKNLTEPMSFGAFMMIIRSKYYPYLLTYFQMDAFRRQIKTGATTTINQITGNMLNKISLPLPEMDDINQFAKFVEQTDKLKFEVKLALEKLETLKKSLMQQYFG